MHLPNTSDGTHPLTEPRAQGKAGDTWAGVQHKQSCTATTVIGSRHNPHLPYYQGPGKLPHTLHLSPTKRQADLSPSATDRASIQCDTEPVIGAREFHWLWQVGPLILGAMPSCLNPRGTRAHPAPSFQKSCPRRRELSSFSRFFPGACIWGAAEQALNRAPRLRTMGCCAGGTCRRQAGSGWRVAAKVGQDQGESFQPKPGCVMGGPCRPLTAVAVQCLIAPLARVAGVSRPDLKYMMPTEAKPKVHVANRGCAEVNGAT